ncbi:MAG: ABC transporter permease [Balneola sp.]
MIRNYILTTIRSIKKNKMYFALNIFGLTLGLAVSFLILLFVLHERSFDTFHKNADNIYQISRTSQISNQSNVNRFSTLPPALGPSLQEDFSYIKDYVRFRTYPRLNISKAGISDSNSAFIETNLRFVDESFFNVFSFELLRGNPVSALNSPNQIVLTQSMALKYFGKEEAIGRSLTIDNKLEVTVSGIVADPPSNSSISFDFLASMTTLPNYLTFTDLNSWDSFSFETFILVKPGSQIDELTSLLSHYVKSRSSLAQRMNFNVDHIEPLSDRYLYSYLPQNSLGSKGNSIYIGIFALISLLILSVASLNYINLATARSFTRAREVGVRKTLGALRTQIRMQFIVEAFILILISIPLALIAVFLIIPEFNNLIQYQLDLKAIDLQDSLFLFLSLIIGLAFLSASYPAFVLSRFNPIKVLKGGFIDSKNSVEVLLKKSLIIFQFVISIGLIMSSFVIQKQLEFIQKTTFKLDDDKIMSINLFRFPIDLIDPLKENIQSLSSIESTSKSFHIPYRKTSATNPAETEMQNYYVDADFVETFNLNIKNGSDFSSHHSELSNSSAVILNETAAAELGVSNLLGSDFKYSEKNYTLIGIVEDFHFESIHNQIRPLIIQLKPELGIAYLSIRINTFTDVEKTINDIELIWRKFTDRALEYTFLEDAYDELYKSEDRLAKLFNYFTILAIFIAALGVFGLIGYLAEKRTKEIGIRKILGAPVISLINLLTRDFTILMGIAFSISLPITYLLINIWIQKFSYKAEINFIVFALLGLLPSLIGILIAVFKGYKTTVSNPIESLRLE